MTKNQIIEEAGKSNAIELLLFKKNKKTGKQYKIKHNYQNLGDLEVYVNKLIITKPEYFYEIRVI